MGSAGNDTRSSQQRAYSGLMQPRYTARPITARSMLPAPGFLQMGGVRPQSRIPGPGIARPVIR